MLEINPTYESWYAEKSSHLLTGLVQAFAALRQVEDPVLRKYITGKIEFAYQRAQTLAKAGLAIDAPELVRSVAEDPDKALPLLREVRSRSAALRGQVPPPDEIVGEVEREIEEARMRAMVDGVPE